MKKVLVTGASGFFGKACLPYLLDHEDLEIMALFNKSEPKEITHTNLSWKQADLFEVAQYQKVLNDFKPTHLLHLAWHVPPKEFWSSPLNNDWARVSIELFKEFTEIGGERFLGAGTLAEYDWHYDHLKEDETPLNPQTLYGSCKKEVYESISNIASGFPETEFAWARIGAFFGHDEPSGKLMSTLIKRAKNGEDLNLLEKETTRCYADVRYLGQALAKLLLESDLKGAVNVAGKEQVSLEQLVDFIKEKTNSNSAVKYGAYTPGVYEPQNLTSDISRMERSLGLEMSKSFWNDLSEMVRVV